jgi:hypothetical protein
LTWGWHASHSKHSSVCQHRSLLHNRIAFTFQILWNSVISWE